MEKKLESATEKIKIHNHDSVSLRESTPLDSENLSHFFSQIPLLGDIDISIARDVDFFSLYNRFKLKFKNFILINKHNENDVPSLKTHNTQEEILGTATFLFHQLFTDNHAYNIAQACDLRISPQRKAIINWSRYFLPQIESLKTQDQVDHIVTTVDLNNTQVINAFIKTRQKKSQKPHYELVRRFNFTSIHGYYPFFKKTNRNIKLRYATEKDKVVLVKYIQKNLMERDLVPTQYIFNLKETIEKSLLYSFRTFIVAFDSDENIIGCCHPLSSTLLQNYFPLSYSQRANNFRQYLKLSSWLGFGRTLTKPFSRTQKVMTLQFQFLHFLFFNHSDVFKAMTYFAFKKSKHNEFLVYTYEDNQYQYRPPRGTIHANKTFGFYEIRSPNEDQTLKKNHLIHKLKNNLWLDELVF